MIVDTEGDPLDARTLLVDWLIESGTAYQEDDLSPGSSGYTVRFESIAGIAITGESGAVVGFAFGARTGCYERDRMDVSSPSDLRRVEGIDFLLARVPGDDEGLFSDIADQLNEDG